MVAHLSPSPLTGTIQIPPSKSMAHRLLICSSLARGFSQVSNVEYSVDIDATLNAMGQLGAVATRLENSVQMEGLPGGFATVTRPVNCVESGSTLRMLIPLFSLTGQQITFTGAPRLFQRPMTVYENIFNEQGLAFGLTPQNLVIKGSLRSGDFHLPGDVSSQFISGLLLALPLLLGDSRIHIAPPVESRSYIELTRSAQAIFGVTSQWENDTTLLVQGGQRYTAKNSTVEGDWSQGAVPAVLAAVKGGITLAGLAENSAQGDKIILSVLEKSGAKISWQNRLLHISGGQLTSPGEIDMADCPDLGPILCTLGLFCQGKTTLVNAGRLRIKESDRISSIETEFKKLGARISSTSDTISVEGVFPLWPDKTTQSHNDHRVVMALSAAALAGDVDITIQGAQAIRKSWPSYFTQLQALGAEVHLHED